MKPRSTRRTTIRATRKRRVRPGSQPRLAASVGRQIDEIYLQLDDQLTHMAQIQLQFDRLRSKIKLL
jgi:hypothetical protein